MQNVMQALYLTRNARGLPASARRYNNVEDIASAFKKMAFENPDREVPDVPAEETSLPPETVPARIEQPKRVFTAEQEEKLQAAMVQLEQQKAKRTKKTQQLENQLSLFDSVA